jgi:hypothetical protein
MPTSYAPISYAPVSNVPLSNVLRCTLKYHLTEGYPSSDYHPLFHITDVCALRLFSDKLFEDLIQSDLF